MALMQVPKRGTVDRLLGRGQSLGGKPAPAWMRDGDLGKDERQAREHAISASRYLLETLREVHGEAGRPDLAPGARVRRP
jgi:hypothetical protein